MAPWLRQEQAVAASAMSAAGETSPPPRRRLRKSGKPGTPLASPRGKPRVGNLGLVPFDRGHPFSQPYRAAIFPRGEAEGGGGRN